MNKNIFFLTVIVFLLFPLIAITPIYLWPEKEQENQKVQYVIEDIGWRIITAYSSTPEQTDSTPFITASNQYVRKGIVATNEMPFGAQLIIEGLENSCVPNIDIFENQDKTNKRYNYRIDIWCVKTEDALKMGRQVKFVRVLKAIEGELK